LSYKRNAQRPLAKERGTVQALVCNTNCVRVCLCLCNPSALATTHSNLFRTKDIVTECVCVCVCVCVQAHRHITSQRTHYPKQIQLLEPVCLILRYTIRCFFFHVGSVLGVVLCACVPITHTPHLHVPLVSVPDTHIEPCVALSYDVTCAATRPGQNFP